MCPSSPFFLLQLYEPTECAADVINSDPCTNETGPVNCRFCGNDRSPSKRFVARLTDPTPWPALTCSTPPNHSCRPPDPVSIPRSPTHRHSPTTVCTSSRKSRFHRWVTGERVLVFDWVLRIVSLCLLILRSHRLRRLRTRHPVRLRSPWARWARPMAVAATAAARTCQSEVWMGRVTIVTIVCQWPMGQESEEALALAEVSSHVTLSSLLCAWGLILLDLTKSTDHSKDHTPDIPGHSYKHWPMKDTAHLIRAKGHLHMHCSC